VWINFKALGFLLPAGADERVRSKTSESFEALGEVVGLQEGGEVLAQWGMAIVVISTHGGLLDRAVHAFDLAVGPGMVGLGQAVINVVAGTGGFEGMSTEDLALLPGPLDVGRSGADVTRGGGEGGAVVGENGVDFTGTISMSSCRKSRAALRVARSTSRAKANLEVRSTATKR
jgi:hypothetical protein